MNSKKPCQCDSSGFCDRYMKEVTDVQRGLCEEREDYRESFYQMSLERIGILKARKEEKELIEMQEKSSSVACIHRCGDMFPFMRSMFFRNKGTKPNNWQLKDVSLKGLERSGTGFVFDLLEKNLLSVSLDQNCKHHKLQISEPRFDNIVLCVKNPYSWYLSYRDFGHAGRDVTNKVTYSSPSECIALWNDYYSAWLNSDLNIYLLRYEDVLKNNKSSIKKIAKFLGVRKTKECYSVKSYVNNYCGRPITSLSSNFNRKDYFLSKTYLHSMKDEDIISIYNTLDKKLLKKLGYTKEP
tara:strand:+ start:367 stop:1257 length:891 start_codon:yes stop_codon:yes gene_type:complete